MKYNCFVNVVHFFVRRYKTKHLMAVHSENYQLCHDLENCNSYPMKNRCPMALMSHKKRLTCAFNTSFNTKFQTHKYLKIVQTSALNTKTSLTVLMKNICLLELFHIHPGMYLQIQRFMKTLEFLGCLY
jgi:hypothetical protein